jgi:addiction module RelE/StbE family toxin
LGELVKKYQYHANNTQPSACQLFRHAMATHMLNHGADIRFIQAMLGHADLDRIEEYIRKENSTAVAIDVVLNVIDSRELILKTHPQAGRIGRVKDTRELVIDGVPFILIYRVTHELQILRVLHDAQQA